MDDAATAAAARPQVTMRAQLAAAAAIHARRGWWHRLLWRVDAGEPLDACSDCCGLVHAALEAAQDDDGTIPVV
jgi:hypothetical protein